VPADVARNGSEVVFELPDHDGAGRLCERLGHRWRVGTSADGETALVTVELRPGEDDLAVLLRAAKLWLVDSALEAVRFRVDGTVGLLVSGTRIRRAA
jgi:hypothetical protein